MPTMIDSLVMTLGLDPSQFVKGHKEASESLKKTKEEATKFGKDIEASGNVAAQSFEKLATKALAFFAILAGTHSIKDFVSQIVDADSALGRLAANIGTTPDALSAMANAVARNGGSAQAAAVSFRALSDAFEELKTTGNTAILTTLYRLQGLSGVPIDIQQGFEKALPGITNSLEKLKQTDPVRANWFARQIFGDEGTANLAQQGWKKFSAETEKSRRLGVVSPESAGAAQKMMESWRGLSQAAQDLGRSILTDLSPHIQSVLDKMTAWVEKNKSWIDQKLGDAINWLSDTVSDFVQSQEFKDLISYVSNPDTWKPFADWVRDMGKAETWKEFKSAIGWIVGQLKEIRKAIQDIIKFSNWLDNQTGLHLPGYKAPVSGDPLALAPGPYANTDSGVGGWFKRNLTENWANRPRFLGGRGSAKERHPRPGKYSDADLQDDGHGSKTSLAGRTFAQKSPGVMARLKSDFGLSDEEAAVVLGNLGHESAGFTAFNEGGGGPGRGWAQWTDPGRKERFFRYAKENNLDPHSDEANYGFLRWELSHTHKSAISALKAARGMQNKMVAFEGQFEGAGVKAYGSRMRYAQAALDAQKNAQPTKTASPNAYGGMAGAVAAMRDAAQPIPSAYLHAAAVAGGAARIANDNRSNHSSSEVNVGNVNIHTAATDAHQIAKTIKPAIEKHSFAVHANTGQL